MPNLEIIFISILLLIFIYSLLEPHWPKNNTFNFICVLLAICLGLTVRIYLASTTTGNYDMESYRIVSDLVLDGKNIYANTYRYNYSPLWAYVLAFFRQIEIVYLIPLSFSIRFFLSLVDVGTLIILLLLAKKLVIPLTRVAVLFFLNPVSIILTGHHGQFDNLTILLILCGAYLFLTKRHGVISWLFMTMAGITKHHVFNEILIILKTWLKSWGKILFLFCLSAALFWLSFLPYWQEGKVFIISNVFLYRASSGLGGYGIPNLMARLKFDPQWINYYHYFFYYVYILFPLLLPTKQILKRLLLVILFMLSFMPGFATQYVVLPIALGSLFGGPPFLLYTLFASFHLFGHGAELNIPRFASFYFVEIWLMSFFWFLWEMNNFRKIKMYENNR